MDEQYLGLSGPWPCMQKALLPSFIADFEVPSLGNLEYFCPAWLTDRCVNNMWNQSGDLCPDTLRCQQAWGVGHVTLFLWASLTLKQSGSYITQDGMKGYAPHLFPSSYTSEYPVDWLVLRQFQHLRSYRGGQFYCQRKSEYPAETANIRQVTDVLPNMHTSM